MPRLRSDDLVVLRAVALHRTFSAAARELGLDHTTVARRMQALSEALGGRLLVDTPGGWELTALGEAASSAGDVIERELENLSAAGQFPSPALRGLVRLNAPEAFVVEVVAPAVACMAGEHPDLACEIVSVTRPSSQHGPSADLDIGVTKPRSKRIEVHRLATYNLGLYATEAYLDEAPAIHARSDLQDHTAVYYVESMLQVTDIDLIDECFPRRRRLIGATSVLAQVALVSRGAGIGLLPAYLASRHPELRPVLPEDIVADLTYWMASRPANLRRPEVAAVAAAIRVSARRIHGPLGEG